MLGGGTGKKDGYQDKRIREGKGEKGKERKERRGQGNETTFFPFHYIDCFGEMQKLLDH